jgi:hypothetical protein
MGEHRVERAVDEADQQLTVERLHGQAGDSDCSITRGRGTPSAHRDHASEGSL